jgi:hypothetical protein
MFDKRLDEPRMFRKSLSQSVNLFAMQSKPQLIRIEQVIHSSDLNYPIKNRKSCGLLG